MSDQILKEVKQELEDAEIVRDSLVQHRQTAFDYYNGGLPKAPSAPELSKIVSKDIKAAVRSLIAEVKPAFNTDTLAEVVHDDEYGDQDQAALESRIINQIWSQTNSGGLLTEEILFNAALQKNAIVKVFYTTENEITYDTYQDVPAMLLDTLLADQGDHTTLEIEEATEGSIEIDGVQIEAFSSVTVKKTSTHQRIQVCSVPLEEFSVNRDLSEMNIQKARFVCHTRNVSELDLISMGYDVDLVESLPTSATGNDGVIKNEHDYHDQTDVQSGRNRQIEIHEAYYRTDSDDDGFAEIHKVVFAEGHDSVLEDTIVEFIPFAIGAAFIMPNEWIGESLFDHIDFIQDAKTQLLRQTIDNAVRGNRLRFTVDPSKCDVEAIANGSDIIMRQTPDAVYQLSVNDMIPSNLAALGYLDNIRSEQGASSINTVKQDQPIANISAHATERQMTKIEMFGEAVIDSLKNTIFRQVFFLIHECLRHNWEGPYRSFETVPSQWPRRDIAVRTKLSSGQKMQKVGALMEFGAMIEKAVAGGFETLINPRTVFELLKDMALAADIIEPEQYLINPSSEEGQHALEAAQHAAQQMQQMEMMKAQAAMNVPLEMEKIRAAGRIQLEQMQQQQKQLELQLKQADDRIKHLSDIEYKYDRLLLDLEKLKAQGYLPDTQTQQAITTHTPGA